MTHYNQFQRVRNAELEEVRSSIIFGPLVLFFAAFAWLAFTVVHDMPKHSREMAAVRDSLAVERQDLIECYQSRMALEDSLARHKGGPAVVAKTAQSDSVYLWRGNLLVRNMRNPRNYGNLVGGLDKDSVFHVLRMDRKGRVIVSPSQ